MATVCDEFAVANHIKYNVIGSAIYEWVRVTSLHNYAGKKIQILESFWPLCDIARSSNIILMYKMIFRMENMIDTV